MSQTLTPQSAVKAILNQGQDPTTFRKGLAERFGITVEEMDAIIAQSGPVRQVSAETVAQERLAEDRRQARANRAAWRAYNHEEE